MYGGRLVPAKLGRGADLFGWEDLEQHGQVGRVSFRRVPELGQRLHGETQLGPEVALGWRGEGIRLTRRDAPGR